MIRGISYCFWSFLILLLGAGAQETQTFKVETNRVVVDVIVTDKKGHHVSGLTVNDFSILEEGAPQKIETFSETNSGSASDQRSTSAMPSSSTQPAGPSAPHPHLVTVVMDLQDNRPENLRKASEAVLKYLEKNLKANDYIAIYSIDRGLRLALPFTNDIARARATLVSIGSGATTSALGTNDRKAVQRQISDLYASIHPDAALGVSSGDVNVTGGRGLTPGNTSDVIIEREIATLRSYLTIQNNLQAKSVFVALKAICASYQDLPGRKNVVLFSEGFLYADDARPQMDAVADAANRANVALYVIDSSGLESKQDVMGRSADNEISQMVNLANESAPRVGGQTGGLSKFDKMRTLGETTRNEQLEYLADVTGGMFVHNMNDLAPAFAKVVDDAQNFYSLTYRPTDSDFDGKFRKIKVDLARKGYDVRYRKGYWAIPRGQAVAMTPAAAQMIATVRGSGYRSPFSLDIYGNVLMAPDAHFGAPVSVSFPGSKVPLTKSANGSTSNVTLLVLAIDDAGKIVGLRQSEWPIQIENKNVNEFTSKTLTLQSELQIAQLVPVTMQAIVGLPGGITAMSARPISITPPTAEKPQLSSMMLTNQVRQENCADKAETLCLETMRLVQPAKANFAANDQLVVYFTVVNLASDPQSKQPRVGMDLKLKSVGADGKTISPQSMQAIPGPTAGSVLVLAQFDLKQLARGKYTAQATAQDLVRKNSASNEAEFTIE
jgi:VWFA-related protein